MKAFTSLEQSKKLAEFLPLKSADMWWNFYSVTTDDTTPQIIHIDTPWVSSFNWNNEPDNIPCWSLAALINVIKPYNENTYTIKGTLDGGALISFDEVTNVMYQENEIVDAVYEMILWLNEKKMI